MIQTTTKQEPLGSRTPTSISAGLGSGGFGKVGFNDVVDEYDLKHMLARYKIAKWCQLGLHPESLK